MLSRNERAKAWLKTGIVTLLCLGGAGYGAWMLYEDFQASGGRGVGKPMAKVERAESRVRRKPASSYIWSRVEQEESLYRKDSVQTSENSAVTIRLNDGSMLEIGERSLVVIDELSNLSLNFGSVVVRKTAGEDVKITVDSSGKSKIEELPIRLNKPEMLSRFFAAAGAKKKIDFSWLPKSTQAAAAGAAQVQVSRDRSFRAAQTTSFKLPDAKTQMLSAELESGRYFWRLTDAAGKPLTQVSQFSVIAAEVIKPLWPNVTQKLVTWGEDSVIQYRWLAPQALSEMPEGQHRLEVSARQDFKPLSVNETISAQSSGSTLKGLPEGRYFWRIVSRYGDLAVSSPIEQFVTERGKKFEIELVLPREAQAVEKLPKLRFVWNADSSRNVDYQWELQPANAAGAQPVKVRGRATSALWDKVASGKYRWRVVALQNNVEVGESSWRDFTVIEGKPVAIQGPAMGQDFRFWETAPEFALQWSADPLVQQEGYRYRVELSKTPEFKDALIIKEAKASQLASKALGLGDGVYHWRVKLVDGANQVVKTSPVSRFIHGRFPPLRAPASAKPERGKIIDLQKEKTDPTAEWEKVEGAIGYEITVLREAPGGKRVPVLKQLTKETALPLKDLPEGRYVFSIRTIDRLKRLGEPMPERPFAISYGAPLAAPKIKSSEVQ